MVRVRVRPFSRSREVRFWTRPDTGSLDSLSNGLSSVLSPVLTVVLTPVLSLLSGDPLPVNRTLAIGSIHWTCDACTYADSDCVVFLRKPYLPLPSHPKLVLIYRSRREAKLGTILVFWDYDFPHFFNIAAR